MFKSPFTFNSRAIFLVYSRIFCIISSVSVCGGRTIAESPECIPAASICSSIPPITHAWLSQIASTSTSIASSRNLSIRTGCSPETSTACSMYNSSSFSSCTISIALPPKTYDGLTKTGYPILEAITLASLNDFAVSFSG